jgi:ribonuclease P protein subunit RPR2
MRSRARTLRIARERIEILMSLAEEEARSNPERAKRYATLAKRIAMRCSMRFPRKWKRRVCKKCFTFLVPGRNYRVRIYKGRVIMTCLECGFVLRIPVRGFKRLKMKED